MDALQTAQLRTVETRLKAALDALQPLLASRVADAPISTTPAASGAVPEPERFKRCLAEVLKHEGGYADHPRDPGGATQRGITHQTLAEWRGKPVTKADVRDHPMSETEAIYRAKYWNRAACDRLPPGVDLIVFDMAVNSGPVRAIRTLQEVVGAAPDGVIGPLTLAAAQAMKPRDLIDRYSVEREQFYRSLKTFATFGRGWMRRLGEVTAKARSWA